MRIEPTGIIRVSGKSGVFDQLREIQKGTELPAKIVSRISVREAVLEIGGKRIHAEFQKGVPAGMTITLRLDEVRDNSLFFKLVDPGGREAFARRLAEMTIADPGRIQANIASAMAKHPAGIFELNALLLGLQARHDRKEGGLTGLLSLLAKLGVDKNVVSDLSLLLAGARIDARALQSLMVIIGFDRDRFKQWSSGKPGSMEAVIDAIINGINGINDPATKETALRQLIALLRDSVETPSGYVSGELPFADEDETRPVHYLGKDDAWVFRVDFSAIGRIEVLARRTREGYLLSLFCGRDETLDLLRQNAEALENNMKNIDPDIHINFSNTAKAINKIVEIYSYFPLNSVFDIRV
ncbi:MAG TPA: hypothetical protein PLM53_15570 [Spirochaetota bacterium]|nr:hypothetical protein [Spirochaetota bacterium]HPC39819.1 hypothetical protein [Spirochaetota bacterium]HPL16315.1 hypothetical protein [Spirochaetota bacterium]HQF09866.1 hypothetical protein [Spirochaetota bacterium]HQH98516.1 hypothetical protein [Spirochaetota bacterium]